MKALVTQLSCTGLPPSASRIAGSTTAGPVKLSGMPSAARQTAASSQFLLGDEGIDDFHAEGRNRR
jgi:hypothetical protein